ncbi:hypothetical protein AB4395_11845 [Vibrio splendidus]|uniref:hypothetical protein n=1 Tax=Vibrio TaxID=662 RepID=UPI000C83D3AD|nr:MULTISPECIES: hypothetical protein [Vibrio]MCT4348161.1 hypothetical protein [Vibrio sp. NC2]PMG53551.1 hypothetical protein BCU88_21325 [Vibrio splendidus]
MKFRKIQISTPISREMEDSLELFQYRAQELIENYENIKKQGFDIGGSQSFSFQNGQISGVGMSVCRHRLKGLFVDFRFFVGNDEPTYFFKIHKAIGLLSTDVGYRRTLKDLKSGWQEKGMLKGWSDISPLEMIQIYFNAQAFHGEHKGEVAFLKLVQAYDNKTLEFVLAMHISDRIQCIRHLRWVLEKVNKNGYLQVPEYRYE